MLILPGRTAAPQDAVGLLLECHGRIRSFLTLARRIADAGGEQEEAVRDAAARVRRYFSEALPLHAQDEEESIVPRLRGREPTVDAELEIMVHEHREHSGPLTRLLSACEELARDPAHLPELAPTVRGSTAELERHFADHLRREESVIFPALRRLLVPSEDAAVMREMRARRGVVGPDLTLPASARPR
jgi:iron-sulfur cluster repair protein YtfE (RIC family)